MRAISDYEDATGSSEGGAQKNLDKLTLECAGKLSHIL